MRWIIKCLPSLISLINSMLVNTRIQWSFKPSKHTRFHSEARILLIILLDQRVCGGVLLDDIHMTRHSHSLSQQIESNTGSTVMGKLAGRRSEQR